MSGDLKKIVEYAEEFLEKSLVKRLHFQKKSVSLHPLKRKNNKQWPRSSTE